jgi:sugar phosphate isomerase/epimerase
MKSATEKIKLAITATPSHPRWAPLLLCGDITDAFRQAAESGCQGVEIHMRQAADVDLNQVKRLMKEYGLKVPTLGTGMAAADGLSFSHLDAAVRTQTVERVLGHVRFAAEIGSAVTIGSLSGRLGDCDVWERLDRRAAALESLGQLCKQARNAGVTVLLEPLNRYEGDYINRLADVVKIAEEIGADNLKLLADTFHMNIEEPDVCQSLRTAGPWIGHVHLADTNREAPGHGHLDVASVLEALDSIAYEGFLSFEVFPLPDPQQAIRDSVQTVRAALDVRAN